MLNNHGYIYIIYYPQMVANQPPCCTSSMLMPLPGTHALACLGEVDGNSAGEGIFAEPLRSFANINYGLT